MKFLLLLLFLTATTLVHAQTYEQKIEKHREKYKAEFLEDENSPLKKEDLKHLQFYPIHSTYQVTAHFTKIIDTSGFDMHTHSGKEKRYRVYGKVEFTLLGKPCTLFVYQSETLMKQKGLEDYLFIPFTDLSNGIETYGGGRYLDFRMGDIHSNKLVIDFNKAYNPYCAYKGGYSCPIPPKENDLPLRIESGEKRYLMASEE